MTRPTNRLERYALAMALVAGMLLLLFGGALLGSQLVTAAPIQQEIPPLPAGGSRPNYTNIFSGAVTTATATTNSNAVLVGPYDESELELFVDQTILNGRYNTVTLTLQRSMDRVRWTTEQVLGTAVVTDTTTWFTTTVPIGRYWRLNIAPSNGNPVTITLDAMLEP